MKIKQIFTLTILAGLIASCGNETDKQQVSDAMKDGVELLKEVPAMKKEFQETQNSSRDEYVKATLKMVVDGKGMILPSWLATKTYINYFDNKIVLRTARANEYGQYLAVKLNGSELYKDGNQYFDTMDVGIGTGTFAEFNFYDENKEDVGSPIIATSGKFNVAHTSDGEFRLAFIGKGKQGKYEHIKEVDLNIDFTIMIPKNQIKDNRSNQ